jgi:hypothetical protein
LGEIRHSAYQFDKDKTMTDELDLSRELALVRDARDRSRRLDYSYEAISRSLDACAATIESLCERLKGADKALEKICTEHQSYDSGESGQYGIGVVDGHRCAANIARAAREAIRRK